MPSLPQVFPRRLNLNTYFLSILLPERNRPFPPFSSCQDTNLFEKGMGTSGRWNCASGNFFCICISNCFSWCSGQPGLSSQKSAAHVSHPGSSEESRQVWEGHPFQSALTICQACVRHRQAAWMSLFTSKGPTLRNKRNCLSFTPLYLSFKERQLYVCYYLSPSLEHKLPEAEHLFPPELLVYRKMSGMQ